MIKERSIKIFRTIDNLAGSFAEFLMQKVNETPEDESFSIALSGGSTPKKIYTYLSDNFEDKINWAKIKIFFGDERCVPPDSEESNYKMANESLFKNISIPIENIFRIRGENNPVKEAARYEEVLKSNLPSLSGIPQFDLILLGIGEDGHTASIFPNQVNLFYSARLCEAAVHPQNKQKRITLTGKIINNAKLVVFIVTGKNKSKITGKIISGDNSGSVFPASFVSPKKGKIIWLLDFQASQLLNNQNEMNELIK
ncbi:MAG: 6-phosphogluconolactonase [Ignavibacteria bacterium]|nr:MAG: 6-phosphogluconolactonase [Ignavibacteria bacterium]